MKLGTFLLGGLAGAAVVMIMRSQSMTAMSNGMGQMWKQRMNDMKENVLEKGMNVKFGSGAMQDMFQMKGNASQSAAGSHTGGLEEVSRLASKDSEVKREVNEILHESGQHQHHI
ncbi:hypothetical protein [Cohnella caldifontis]|uniref:hypothetical protein n=1 Tax=Cohnella caldifontis TaxID=3027471 RepID=UPI0023EC3E59|nr:hypothetical protein [Cohnella sp. YIM B05605]